MKALKGSIVALITPFHEDGSVNFEKLQEILEKTADQIRDRIDIENEIRILLGSRRMEQRIMDAVPFLIIAYIGTVSRGFFDVLYHNAAGILFMTVCLAVYLAAFLLSEKILQIGM